MLVAASPWARRPRKPGPALVPAPWRLGSLGHERRDQKGNTALEPGVITWLQLRFGGGVWAAARGEQASLVAQARSTAMAIAAAPFTGAIPMAAGWSGCRNRRAAWKPRSPPQANSPTALEIRTKLMVKTTKI